jgi:hypothetical protein
MTSDPDRPTDEDRVHALQHDYMDLLHAVQTACEYGIAGMHGAVPLPTRDPHDGVPCQPQEWAIQKHLRTGLNGVLISEGALARLLISKGLMTELEYWEALVVAFREAVVGYERELSAKFGTQVRLA